MKKTIDHIGVAVRNIEDSIRFYENVLGATLIDQYSSNAQVLKARLPSWRWTVPELNYLHRRIT